MPKRSARTVAASSAGPKEETKFTAVVTNAYGQTSESCYTAGEMVAPVVRRVAGTLSLGGPTGWRITVDDAEVGLADPMPLPRAYPTVSVRVMPRSIPKYHIFVKTTSGPTTTLDWKSGETVEQLKIRIWDKTGLPAEQQRLIFAGKQLQDDDLLSSRGIQPDATLHLVQALRGD